MAAQHINFIDTAKGICILLVLLGHVYEIPLPLFKYIYSFHMPAFFFISGYLFNTIRLSENYFEFFKIKWKRLIIPYFSMGLICYTLFVIYPIITSKHIGLDYWYFVKPIIGILYSMGTTEWLPNCSPLWFLTCLFCTEQLFFQILKNNKKTILFVVTIVISGILGYLTSLYIPFKLPWNIDTSLTAICFYALGFMVRRRNLVNLMINKTSYLLFPIALLINYVSIKYNPITIVNLDANKYGNILLFYLGAISGIVCIILVSNWIQKSSILTFFGRNTMPIIGFNYAINTLVAKTINIFTIINTWPIRFILVILYFIALLFCFEKFRNKSNLINKYIYGK
jgi:fucose 4-O-acetylase-like acetyltransferase